MPMLIYKSFQSLPATTAEFVQFWSGVYGEDQSEKLYTDNIRRELNEQRILELFKWKNGGRLSALKEASVRRNFVMRQRELQELQPDQNIEDCLSRFAEGGVIFRIFWLHCWCPDRFPIYDQHVHRAMAFIKNGQPEEIPADDASKTRSYIEMYLPFFATLDGIDLGSEERVVDRALWAFGKFLKRNLSIMGTEPLQIFA
jgi:hypothetical protein